MSSFKWSNGKCGIPFPSDELRSLVALQMTAHMGLPATITPVVTERSLYWLNRTYDPKFGNDEALWLRAAIERITKKPRHFHRMEGERASP